MYRSPVAIDELPAHVHAFVAAHVNSVEQIAILNLLRANPAREWTIVTLSVELRSVPSAVARRLEDLYVAGVLTRRSADSFRFEPASPEMAASIEELAICYRERPNRIIELIYSHPPKSLHAFADAFKLKKEK